jgi:HAE1 family hydrophobic/amphiphilic exporter-1
MSEDGLEWEVASGKFRGHLLTILSGLPSAGAGALRTLPIFRTVLSIYSFVGIIMLMGIVKKNAIMMLHHPSHLHLPRPRAKPPGPTVAFQSRLTRPSHCVLIWEPIA